MGRGEKKKYVPKKAPKKQNPQKVVKPIVEPTVEPVVNDITEKEDIISVLPPLPKLSPEEFENLITLLESSEPVQEYWPNTAELLPYLVHEQNCTADIVKARQKMRPADERSMDDILGTPAEGERGAPSILSRMMDPNAGGKKGSNKNGLGGLLSLHQPASLTPQEKLARMKKAFYKQRQGMTKDDYVYDSRGRKVKGARKVSMEEMQYGLVPPGQRQKIDKEATKKAIRENIVKMKAENAKKREAAAAASASNNAKETTEETIIQEKESGLAECEL